MGVNEIHAVPTAFPIIKHEPVYFIDYTVCIIDVFHLAGVILNTCKRRPDLSSYCKNIIGYRCWGYSPGMCDTGEYEEYDRREETGFPHVS
jgi:hypothetical protein